MKMQMATEIAQSISLSGDIYSPLLFSCPSKIKRLAPSFDLELNHSGKKMSNLKAIGRPASLRPPGRNIHCGVSVAGPLINAATCSRQMKMAKSDGGPVRLTGV